MQVAARDVSPAATWGPVRRGYSVAFANGERGRLEEIRVRDEAVELIVGSAASGRRVAVDVAEVEAILPRQRRIIVGSLSGRDDAAGVEAAGGIIRLPARHSARLAPPEDSA